MVLAVKKQAAADQRRFERRRTALAAQMFVPAETLTIECQVVDLSGGGAGITCSEMPPAQAFAVLYVGGFGRFPAVVTRVVREKVVGVRFVLTDARRERLIEKLTRFVESGASDFTALRRHKRAPGTPQASFTCADGERVECAVADISLTGASLKTKIRPPVGETIRIGRMPARVVRWHEEGIAVVFRALPVEGIEA
jgi:hypothetical protein